MTTTAEGLRCDMRAGCTGEVTMIDSAGFVYCEPHGLDRRQYEPCRKLRPYEKRKIERGEMLTRY